MRKDIQRLLDSNVTGYAIYHRTGIPQSKISGLRTGKMKLDNLSLMYAEKLAKCAKTLLDD